MLARSPAHPARRSHSQPCFPAPSADIIGHPIAARNFRTPRRRAAPRFRGRLRPRAFVAARGPMLSQPSAIPPIPVPVRNLKLLQPPAFLRSLAAARGSALSQLPATPCFRGRPLPRDPTNARRSPPGPPAPYPEAVASSPRLGRIAALSPFPRRTPPTLPSQRFGQTASFCEICIDLNPAPKQIYAYQSKMRS